MGKDVQDQLTAIHHRAIQQPFQVAGLHGGEFTVGDHQGGLLAARFHRRLIEFSCSPERLRILQARPLTDHCNGQGSRAAHQPLELGQFPDASIAVLFAEGEQQHPFRAASSWGGADLIGPTLVQIEIAEDPEVIAGDTLPTGGVVTIRNQQHGRPLAVGAAGRLKTQPTRWT